jgi:O-antigen biosynthesis protein WbqV
MVGEKIADILKVTEKLGLPLNRLPRMQDLQSAAGQKIQLKPVAIEDLLGRPQAVLDRQAMSRIIVGKRILVTGAGGSIGSELVRQISDFHPAAMALVDAGEFNLYSIDMELGKRHPQLQKYPMLADVRAYDRLQNIFHIFQPDLVVHAAALKHVPLVEENPLEGMQTNCFGTQNVVDACCAHGVKTMVMISTDKAVNPTNIMGATKRVAEQYCQAVDAEKLGPRIVTVRFGNVLGSTGSVVPLFTKQLEDGGPLTVTHPDVERYFMTIREAVELVLQAAAVGVELEDLRGKIFVLDMGSPVKIVDLARQMIRLSGLRPETDIQIAYTGLRPGEKLFEEIFHGAEPPVATQWDGLLIASPRTLEVAEVRQYLQDMKACCQSEDLRAAIACLKIMVPELGPDHRPNSRPDHDKATAIDASEKIAE